ncbi:MAG: 50S ribosomal protein L17 [Candidatus Gottesmanbacteria bacterium]
MKNNKDWLLWRNLIYSLILFGKIKTTKHRAKAIVGLIDRLVNKMKKGTVASKRDVLKFLPERVAFDKLSKEIVPMLGDRNSGYTRVINIGKRKGDNTSIVLLEWVKSETPKLANETNKTNKEKPASVPTQSGLQRDKHVKTDKNK